MSTILPFSKQPKVTTQDAKKTYSCFSCGLYKDAFSPKMEASGNFRKGILNIGSVTSSPEDNTNSHWKGKDGRVLKRTLSKLGIDIYEDCLNINAVMCRCTTSNGRIREPTSYELACCRFKILNLIKKYKPKLILLYGDIPIKSIIGYRWKSDLDGIEKWRGWTIPDRDLKAWVCPVFHPSYVDEEQKPEVDTIWKQDLKRALKCLKKGRPVDENEEQYIYYIDDQKELDHELDKINLGQYTDFTTFDYETTGLKPHARGHKIVCCSIAADTKHCIVFMMPQKKSERLHYLRYLASTSVRKTAHNMKFEKVWSETRLKAQVNNLIWDSMLAAHIVDNRRKVTGLKFQSCVQFGIYDYDSHIKPYLVSVEEKNANSFNRIYKCIEDLGKKELLKYCAMDSILERKLAILQMKQIMGT